MLQATRQGGPSFSVAPHPEVLRGVCLPLQDVVQPPSPVWPAFCHHGSQQMPAPHPTAKFISPTIPWEFTAAACQTVLSHHQLRHATRSSSPPVSLNLLHAVIQCWW